VSMAAKELRGGVPASCVRRSADVLSLSLYLALNNQHSHQRFIRPAKNCTDGAAGAALPEWSP
jgi:hypothetical protein